MAGLRFGDVADHPTQLLDLTSLTGEFAEPSFAGPPENPKPALPPAILRHDEIRWADEETAVPDPVATSIFERRVWQVRRDLSEVLASCV